MYSVLGAVVLVIGLIHCINLLQEHKPSLLPAGLRSWSFLPLCLRSLEPADRLIQRLACCSSCCLKQPGECCEAVTEAAKVAAGGCADAEDDVEAGRGGGGSSAAAAEREALVQQDREDKNGNLARVTILPLRQEQNGDVMKPV